VILSDADISARIASDGLLDGFDSGNVKNCGYTLRAARVFNPESGDELLIGDLGNGAQRHTWDIAPAETLVVMTRETVRIPPDLCASYTPLHRLASGGLMLLNAAIVEPGYEGPLSCFMLNFSSVRVQIAPDEGISKIVFHTLNASPAALKREAISAERYAGGLSKAAQRYNRSFLDVSRIADRAAERARQSLKGWVLGGGALVAVLVLWASLEPVTSRWLWEKTGVTSSTQRVEDIKLQEDMRSAREALIQATDKLHAAESDTQLKKQIAELQVQMSRLSAELDAMKRGK